MWAHCCASGAWNRIGHSALTVGLAPWATRQIYGSQEGQVRSVGGNIVNRLAQRLCVLGVALAGAQLVMADTMYVMDRLELGIHEDKSADSAIVRLVPSGTALEVMVRDEAFVQIRTVDGVVGWVDGRYLMPEKPAQIELAELQTRHSETQSQLEEAELRVEDLDARLEDLSNVDATPGQEAMQNDAASEVERLTEENLLLREELLNIERSAFAEVILTPPVIDKPTPPKQPKVAVKDQSVFGLSKFQWMFIVALSVLCFGLGAYLVDYNARKRHGGFRL